MDIKKVLEMKAKREDARLKAMAVLNKAEAEDRFLSDDEQKEIDKYESEIRSWDIKITANDLSEAVLAAARRGIYNEYALRTTPPEIISSYFTKDGNIYKIKPELKQLVSFGQINLSDKEQLRRVEKSQIVFCRNVIIYFDDDMKRKVISAFYDNLEPNGMLLIGHSESLHNISRAFKPEHHTGTIVYRKMS